MSDASTQPHSVPAGQPHVINRRSLLAAVAGNAFEFYDFTSYTFFAVYIAHAFFPAQGHLVSLLLAVIVYGIGYITRPLGAVMIGRLADRRGRRAAMKITTICMAVGTVGLCFTPSYEQIGLAAPLIIGFSRLLQGVALGGEAGCISAYLIESAPAGRRGFYNSWQLASQGIASLLAGVVGVTCLLLLSDAQMYDWGWRIPFFLGLLFIPLAWMLRAGMPESLHEHHMAEHRRIKGFFKQFEGQWYVLLVGSTMVMGATVSVSAGLYMTTYAASVLHLSHEVSMSATMLYGLSTLIGALAGGFLSDRWGRVPVMLTARIVLLIAILPAFYWLVSAPSFSTLAVVTFMMGFLTSVFSASGTVLGSEVYPRHIRAQSLAITGALCLSIFGSTTQAAITWLIKMTGNPMTPAFYMLFWGLVSLWSITQVEETRHYRLHDEPAPENQV